MEKICSDDESSITNENNKNTSDTENDDEEFGNNRFVEILQQSDRHSIPIQYHKWINQPPPPKLNYPAVDEYPDYADYLMECLLAIMAKIPSVHKSKMSTGLWLDRVGLVKMMEMKGKHFVSMGHYLDKSFYLLPEESLFLVDRGCLTLYRPNKSGDVMMSREESFRVLLANERQLNLFIVYRYLKNLGFIVNRYGYGFNWLPSEVQKELGISAGVTAEDELSSRFQQELQISKDSLDVLQPDFAVYKPNSQFSKRKASTPDFVVHVVGNDLTDIDAMYKTSKINSTEKFIIAIANCGIVTFLDIHN